MPPKLFQYLNKDSTHFFISGNEYGDSSVFNYKKYNETPSNVLLQACNHFNKLSYLKISKTDDPIDFSIIDRFIHLETLILETGITYIPKEIANLSILTKLILNDNDVTDMSPICTMKNLEELRLTNNKIDAIPEEIKNMTELSILFLNKNNISNIENLCNLKNVKKLELSYNNITEIPKAINKLKKLKFLWLISNEIDIIPSEIGELSKLKELFIAENNIQSVPIEIFNNVFRFSLKFKIYPQNQAL